MTEELISIHEAAEILGMQPKTAQAKLARYAVVKGYRRSEVEAIAASAASQQDVRAADVINKLRNAGWRMDRLDYRDALVEQAGRHVLVSLDNARGDNAASALGNALMDAGFEYVGTWESVAAGGFYRVTGRRMTPAA